MAAAKEDKAARYQKIGFLGEGQFALVYKAHDSVVNQLVAIKKIKRGNRKESRDGINRTALREIKIMNELEHDNILSLLDVFGTSSSTSLVFDFMDTDLETIIKDPKIILTQGNIKAYSIMILRGLEYLHMNWILHRDLKPSNLLINIEGCLKIADFGLAKSFGSPSRAMTHEVVTRWYRAPELIFGARQYGTGVDLWAVGCIMAELMLREPFMPGKSDLDQLTQIFMKMGTPTDEEWPHVSLLPNFIPLRRLPAVPLSYIFTAASHDMIKLMNSLFALNPLKRCSSTEALCMEYFSDPPAPTIGANLPLPAVADVVVAAKTDSSPEVEAKKRKLA